MSRDYVGRIRVDELIGSGGMGSVYKGYDEILGRFVALKKADRTTPDRAIDKMRFLREARALSKLNHPNICKIHDFIEQPDADYLILEYISGRSLKRAIDDGLDERHKLDIGHTLAQVLEATHEVNIVHRDLKPENVMITDEGVIKVLDFGLARSLDDELLLRAEDRDLDEDSSVFESSWGGNGTSGGTTSGGETVGTLLYMSPEQANGELGTTSSDLYSLGVILYLLFTGKTPYRRRHTATQLIFHVAMGKTIPIERRAPDLDPDLMGLIDRLLSRKEGNRPSAKEAVEIIRQIRQKPEKIKIRRRLMIGAIVMFLSIVAAILFTRHFSAPEDPVPEKPRIVLLPFVNETDDDTLNWISWGLRNTVAQELADRGELDLVTAQDTKQMIETAGLISSDPPRRKNLERMKNLVGANRWVRATVRSRRNEYVIRFTVYDPHGPIEASQVTGQIVTDAGRLLASELARRLGAESDSEEDVPSNWSEVPLVNQLKAMGDQYHMTSGPAAAAAFFLVCSHLDPEFARTRLQLASCLVSLGKLQEARDHVQTVLDQTSEDIDARTEIICLRVKGRIDEKQGHLQQSEAHYRRALDIASAENLTESRADTLHGLATVKIIQGELETAEKVMQEAIDLYKSAGNHQGATDVLHNFAVALHDKGDSDRAEEIYLDVLAASHDMDDRTLTAKCHLNYGVLVWDRGEFDAAEKHYLQALEIFQKLNMPEDVATIYNNLAGVALYRDDYQEAQRYFFKALDLHQEIGNALGQALTSWNIAELYAFQDQYEEADRYVPTAIAWYQDNYEVWYLKATVDCHLNRQDSCLEALEKTQSLAGEAWNEEHQELWDRFRNSAKD